MAIEGIKDGAKLVQYWRDVVEELPRAIKEQLLGLERPLPLTNDGAPAQQQFEEFILTEEERKVFDLLSADVPAHIDQLLLASEMNSSDLMNALLGLEMKDRIKQLPGKSFIKRM